ncbi:hypothetical protein GJ496_002758 [Pomphorhynchus laevis]|nr:hypothetical protein GJ496_002758 [Pomphorhynchus laevis]
MTKLALKSSSNENQCASKYASFENQKNVINIHKCNDLLNKYIPSSIRQRWKVKSFHESKQGFYETCPSDQKPELSRHQVEYACYIHNLQTRKIDNSIEIFDAASFKRLDNFSKWLLCTKIWQRFIVCLVICDLICIFVASMLEDSINDRIQQLVGSLQAIDRFAVFCFTVEIILKWCADFKAFWRSIWNVLDMIITFVLLSVEIMDSVEEITADMSAIIFKKATFIIIYSLVLVEVFQNISKVKHNMFRYPHHALLAVFELMTMDRWHRHLENIDTDVPKCIIWIFLAIWLILAGTIINPMLLGVVVQNFQSLRTKHSLLKWWKDKETSSPNEELREVLEQFGQSYRRHKTKPKLDGIYKIAEQSSRTLIDSKELHNVLTSLKLKKTKSQCIMKWTKTDIIKYYDLLIKLNEHSTERIELIRKYISCICRLFKNKIKSH